ncbi:MAG: HAD-IA family hydrolase [Actinobacteria bacterium]|nr:HAD-IA family hydrolase [Actinomycetota bacterium]
MFKQLPAAVLWDMDGTLIDSEPYWLKSEGAFAKANNSSWTEQDGLSLVGMSLYDSSKIIKERVGSDLEPEQIIEHLTDGVAAQLKQEIFWRPGARELLVLLRKKRIKTALVTMSMHRMAKQVADSIGFDAFDVIVAGDDVRQGKPHPEPYLKAAELLGEKPEDCVAFEDSLTGLRSAEAANTKAVGVKNIVEIPIETGRILWPTLEGVTMADLRRLFK